MFDPLSVTHGVFLHQGLHHPKSDLVQLGCHPQFPGENLQTYIASLRNHILLSGPDSSTQKRSRQGHMG